MKTSTMLKKANAASISRALTAAGFKKSVEETTAIRGYHRFSTGFKVQDFTAAVVISRESSESIEEMTESLYAMSQVLISKGFLVGFSADGRRLVVGKSVL
jgi:hypothetical protein